MPLYEFECEQCGQRFDVSKRIAARTEPETCPKCEGRASLHIAGFAVLSGASPCSGSSCAEMPPMAKPCCGGGGCPY